MLNNNETTHANIHKGDGISRRGFITRSALTGLAATSVLTHFATSAQAQTAGRPAGVGSQSTALPRRRLGTLEVSAIGLGCMSMKSGTYNPPRSKEEMIPVIRSAVERGVTLSDTAEIYGPFTDEELVGDPKPRNPQQFGRSQDDLRQSAGRQQN